ncbi:NRAMP family divalent metal transporter [Macrococcoides goetzii]|uniref:NRAMP family divalent metal transporter n=1 Tax=Macrococcus sp. PK TaxID=2801919 RepID=UPI001F0F613F|nr:NRAMP family divalent metal transporter [Macrococcus sp. PK]MCH4983810.1 divalent metal cation transporter [Macrococcus sp. PK]MCH4986033.1 divalent metal cation transporter [Macrococcus sp. PK]
MNNEKPKMTAAQRRLLFGAIFLMATSAIGPAFLTQTTIFTEQFLASFAFAILLSIIIDIGAQLNIWRVLTVTGKRGQDISNEVFKGLGSFIAILIVLGGLAFNIGNVAGAGLGFNALLGIDVRIGAVITGILAIIIFSSKSANKMMDVVTQILGVVMLLTVAFVMIKVQPPYGEALTKMVMPDNPLGLVMPLVTIVGGTVGGYITFAGAHRLIDDGMVGKANLPFVSRAANLGILTTGLMRFCLFLAVLGVVATGVKLDPTNPPASAFQHALGPIGPKIFGLVLLAAALTSVIGAAYTSASFLKGFHPVFTKHNNIVVISFIVFSTIVFLLVGKPVKLLVLAGAFNGLILPITLTAILFASKNKRIVGDYKHPTWLLILGVIAVLATIGAGFMSIQSLIDLWNQ